MRFKPGQKVVCTAAGNNWYKTIGIDKLSFFDRLKLMFRGNKTFGPKFNEIVTIDNVKQNDGFVPLIEWRHDVYGQYQESCFEPLVKEGVMEAEIEEIFSSESKSVRL